ncbi:MAG TPA: MFS transporter [Gaiellaceae bacterium]|nr:MFS transporter [Gaiellaceae bacterium]HWJ44951.1 MFS transporter [Gaiellaceae bacterium]
MPRNSNFMLLFAARGISYFGTYLAPIAVAFAVLDLTGSASDTGIAFACWTVAQVSTLLIGGVVSDRLPRRLVMISSDAANVCVRASMGVLLLSGHARIWEIFVLQALGGAATAFYSPASSGLVPELVEKSQLQKANALMGIARYLAFPLGAATGGAIVATVGPGAALLVDAGTYAASVLFLSAIRLPARLRAAAAPNFLRELSDGWRAFTEHTWVWLLTVWIALYFLITYAPFFVLGPYIAKHDLGGASAWGTVVTGEGLGSLAGALVGLRVRPSRPWIVVGAIFALTSVQSILLAAHVSFVAIAVAAVIAGFSFSLGSVIYETGVQHEIAPDKLSRVSAYSWMCAMVFLPLGYALAGPIAAGVGMSAYLVFGAVWIVATTLVVYSVPAVRNYRFPTAPQAATAA